MALALETFLTAIICHHRRSLPASYPGPDAGSGVIAPLPTPHRTRGPLPMWT